MIQLWWVWLAAAVVLLVLEVLSPAYVFLGFAIGAAAVGVLLLLGLSAGWPVLLLICAVVALIGWALLRRFMGVRKGQTKIWTRDINED
ncbi:hypothetical protein [Alloyangia pacifica]|uniref:NfeD-like C-terminal domain-containing protein n=1 Tax=Alloyangia pacifica TaxID=311180 RepID=A0A1I6VAG0_9RHOB|nr:hypothetical protein [Alloyangia pacifica]SDH86459.1 hypothetical protein SAMN04488245_110107 [Alloyangia pacifica]SFT10728.1 hypothetical protein SAMN04488050_110158 [Alloyangia pacifica]